MTEAQGRFRQVPSDKRQLCVGSEKKEEKKGFGGFSNKLLGHDGNVHLDF